MGKYIPGYEGLYTISELGVVTSTAKQCTLTPHLTNSGYRAVKLWKEGKYMHKYIHRLIAESYIHRPNKKDTVNHIDGNKLNNACQNLEWVTKSENSRHAYSTGLMVAYPQRGSKHGEAKLHERDIPIIKKLYESGFSYSEIANKFNVTKGTIWKVYHGLSWTHVNG